MNELSTITSTKKAIKPLGNRINKTNKNEARKVKGLGKSEFLKLLITQLEHQDPLRPMEDKEFIAQMAQFSALEQMIEMNKSMTEMKKFSLMQRLNTLLGKKVRVYDEKSGKVITGIVSEVNLVFEEPRIRVNKGLYKASDILGILYEGKNLNSDKQTKQTNSIRKE